ncbi:MAG: ABC transporter permease [Acidimicrobiia bacterium]
MATVTAPTARRRPGAGSLERFIASGGVVWILVLVLVVVGAIGSEDFRTVTNLSNVSRQAVVLSLVSLGQFVVVLTAGVDLSVGMVVKLTAITSAIVIGGQDERTILGIGIALLVGLVAGAVNGFIVAQLRVPAFITTLGTLAVIQGISLLIASTPKGQTSSILSDFWAWRAGRVFAPVILTAAIWVVMWIVLHRTVWGRHVYAVGADPHIATVSGVRTRLVQFSVYAVAGILAAVGGILTATRAGVGDPNAGFGLEFESLAAVVIGGASLAGGRGRIIGVLGGVLLLSVIGNVFNLLGVAVWYQQLLKGSIILFGAAAYLGKREGV